MQLLRLYGVITTVKTDERSETRKSLLRRNSVRKDIGNIKGFDWIVNRLYDQLMGSVYITEINLILNRFSSVGAPFRAHQSSTLISFWSVGGSSKLDKS